jgi:rod shape-determining protein MreD
VLTFCFFLLGILLIVLETTLLHSFPSWLGRPDFIYILVAYTAYRFAWIPGLLLVFSLGWIMDVLTGIDLGIFPLECLAVFVSLKAMTTNNPLRESMYQIPLVGLSYFIVQLVRYTLYAFTEPQLLPEWSWGKLFAETGILLFATIPCFVLLNALSDFLQKRKTQPRPLKRRG